MNKNCGSFDGQAFVQGNPHTKLTTHCYFLIIRLDLNGGDALGTKGNNHQFVWFGPAAVSSLFARAAEDGMMDDDDISRINRFDATLI